jgi:DsbC/DsbD-like thiol-disulfide interchange protein
VPRALSLVVTLLISAGVHALAGQTRKPAEATPSLEDLLAPRAALSTVETPHMTVMASASVGQVARGQKFALIVDATPRRGIHIYAPGKHGYQVIALTLDAQPWLGRATTKYPTPEIYEFKPLAERVEVYQQPFQLRSELSIVSSPDARKQLAGRTSVTISGKLEYQACDDKVCYKPETVRLSWTLGIKT